MLANLKLQLDSRTRDELTTLVSRAAAVVKQFQGSTVERRLKSDQSPVTAADEASQSVLLEGLAKVLPGVPVVSEEAARPGRTTVLPSPFLLIDPLDGTREFLAGRDEFTINVAIVADGAPAWGCIAAPLLNQVWRGGAGYGAERLDLEAGADVGGSRRKVGVKSRALPQRDVVIAVSRSHLDPQTQNFIKEFPAAKCLAFGSSLKFCRVAEGSVDLYPRLAPTCEWDIAAGHAIVKGAGGAVIKPAGGPLVYGQSACDFRVPAFVALGDPAAVTRICQAGTGQDGSASQTRKREDEPPHPV